MDLFDTPSLEIICYTAGLFDGEGSIWYIPSSNRHHASLSQSESNNGEILIKWLQASWGFGSCNAQQKTWQGKQWYQWHWSIAGAPEFHFFLRTLMPYLHVKRQDAEAAVIAMEDRTFRRTAWSHNEDRFLRQHWAEHTEIQLSRKLGRSVCGMRHRARKLGLPDKRQHGYRRMNTTTPTPPSISPRSLRVANQPRNTRGRFCQTNAGDSPD